MRPFADRPPGIVRRTATAVAAARAEIAQAVAVLAGWTLLTWGVASLLVWQVWPISFGLLVLLLCGWRWLWEVFSKGLYVLTGADA